MSTVRDDQAAFTFTSRVHSGSIRPERRTRPNTLHPQPRTPTLDPPRANPVPDGRTFAHPRAIPHGSRWRSFMPLTVRPDGAVRLAYGGGGSPSGWTFRDALPTGDRPSNLVGSSGSPGSRDM